MAAASPRFTRSLQERVASQLQQEQWSPEQISGRLRLEGIAMVGKTTIYNWLHADKRSGGDAVEGIYIATVGMV